MTLPGLRATILLFAGAMLGWSVLVALWLWRTT